MTTPDSESRFIAATEAFDLLPQESGFAMRSLEDWYARFDNELERYLATPPGGQAHRVLSRQLAGVRAAMRLHVASWPGLWTDAKSAQDLAEAFDDRVVVLVYGKFNAGKSSFCNFMAQRYLAHDEPVTWFRLDAGQLVESSDGFREGGTETTTEVQGVRLGAKLLLLDTPGLHSVSRDNAALTQRFTESADLMLWLTSSTSPGQVQELEELGRELHRHKPLLPVVTRSDVYEEDELDGELINALRNKTPQNRALQEADVHARAQEKLAAMGVDQALVQAPVSVSVMAAREAGSTSAALADAGFERLYDALLATAGPALAYKRRKRAEVYVHYIEESVLGAMQGDTSASLRALDASCRSALDELGPRLDQVERAVWRQVMPALPEQLERHAASLDIDGLLAAVSTSIHTAFVHAWESHCSDCEVMVATADAQITLAEHARYERVALENGSDGGSPEDPSLPAVSYARLYAALDPAVRATSKRLAAVTAEQCRAAIAEVMEDSAELQALIERYSNELAELRLAMRSEPVSM